MKPEEQRIAIAEACGWKIETYRTLLIGVPPNMVDNGGHECVMPLPDYLNDLNAMHEAVESLRAMDGPQWWDFQKHLLEECGTTMNCIQATAAQRAEAFLKTLNLWKP